MTLADTPSSSNSAPAEPAPIAFGPYLLDRANARLLHAGQAVALTPKAFDVLHLLASRPDRLVSKEELLATVWADVLVSDASVKVCVREIRKALNDDADAPRFIQTVHRRGYRFIGGAEAGEAAERRAAAAGPAPRPAPPLIGRHVEVDILRDRFNRAAAAGARQCLFLSGGPGSGKTALVEAFLRTLEAGPAAAPHRPLILTGHCFEQFGTDEPYMPVWEAIGRLAREQPGSGVAALLERHAAARELPVAAGASLLPSRGPANSTPTPTATATAHEPRGMSERLLREMTDAVESLAGDTPLVLVLEDVHWADYSTLDLISALARRRHSPARLLLLATYRPDELHGTGEHPLRDVVHGLLTASLARELPLRFLGEAAVAEYLASRFDGTTTFPPALSRRLHQRTDGHPLFLVHLVDDLVEQGVIVRHDDGWRLREDPGGKPSGPAAWAAVLETQVPHTVRAIIELQLQRLGERERHVLDAAAVAGVEFSAAAVAAALEGAGGEGDVVGAEQLCDELSRRQRFLEPRGLAEWPDGSAATRYRFAHELYHNVVYERVTAARRARMHRALGLRMEAAWGARAAEEAATLAVHFEAGRDWCRAVRHLRQAAAAASRQFAHREAVRYLRRAQDLLGRLPDDDRAEHELPVLMSLGVNLQVTDGFAAPEFKQLYARALSLCETDTGRGVHDTFPVLWGVWMFNKVRSDLHEADAVARRMLALAEEAGDPALLVQAHQAMCMTQLCLGNFADTVDHMERVLAIYDPVKLAGNAEVYGQDPGVASMSFGSIALWLMGRADESLDTRRRAVELASQLGRPSTLALATYFSTMLHQLRGDAVATRQSAEKTIGLAADDGFTFWHAGGTILRGWAMAVGGEGETGIAEIRRGLEAWTETGSRTYRTYHLGVLADALLRNGRGAEALGVLEEALAAARDMPEGIYEPQLRRLKELAEASSLNAFPVSPAAPARM